MLRKYFNKTRQGCWKLIDRKYPEERDKYAIAGDLVHCTLKKGFVVLDVGCGHRSIGLGDDLLGVRRIGLDLVLDDVKRNKSIDLGVCASINCIPLRDQSVDVIVCNMVFEHLARPELAFSELARILKPNGYLIFMTPCVYNIVTILNRLIPNRFHQRVGNLVTGVSESDIFPTFYRANSRWKLRRLLSRNKLVERDFIMYQPPPYAFVFSKFICTLVIRYYQVINKYSRLGFLRGVIIARYQRI